MTTSTAQAHPNIAFIKYWGNRDNTLRLPVNGSISMNLDGLFTRTTVNFRHSISFDELIINGHEVMGTGLNRVSYILNIICAMVNIHERPEVMTENNFPAGAGMDSSASAFAALAGSRAAGLNLSEAELSCLVWRGLGSAARSILGGFIEWQVE
jgi:diphosphomevalonate decarboxylase